MFYSISATAWVFLVFTYISISGNKSYISKYNIDLRDRIKIPNMNKTELEGYRRLRTLSQLFFETIPEICLQFRMLWVMQQWTGDNKFGLDIDVSSLIWSIALAAVHLVLEAGIVYLDKGAFQVSFMEYALQCLSGRVQWIPFQHLITNVVQNQVYIFDDGDRKQFDKDDFDATEYEIYLNKNYVDDQDHVQNQFELFLQNDRKTKRKKASDKWYWSDDKERYKPLNSVISQKIEEMEFKDAEAMHIVSPHNENNESTKFSLIKEFDNQATQRNVQTNQQIKICKSSPQHLKIYNREIASNRDSILRFNYGKIKTNVFGMQYYASYQFSKESMDKLTTTILNCSPMIVPPEFQLSTTNNPIRCLIKHLLCRARIKLGPKSFGSSDIKSLCYLYEASFNKIRLDISNIDTNLINSVLMKIDEQRERKFVIDAVIEKLIYFGEVHAIKWLSVCNFNEINSENKQSLLRSFPHIQSWSEWISYIKLHILTKIVNVSQRNSPDDVRLDVLRNCFNNKFFIATSFEAKGHIKWMIEKILNDTNGKCVEDKTWHFVAIFLLLYSQGRIFNDNLDENMNNKLKQWVPSNVEMGETQIPFSIFENCGIYKPYIEEILVHKCKEYIISKNNIDYTAKYPNAIFDIWHDAEWWKYFDLNQSTNEKKQHIATLFDQLQNREFNINNIALLDELFVTFKIDTSYNDYLQTTKKDREKIKRLKEKTQKLNIAENVMHVIREAKPENSNTKEHVFKPSKLFGSRGLHSNSVALKRQTAEEFNKDITNRVYQIYEVIFSISGGDENGFEIYFDEKNEHKRIYFKISKGGKDVKFSIYGDNDLNNDHAALIEYNYHMLCSKGITNVSPIIVKTDTNCDVSIKEMTYTKLYKEHKQKELNQLNINIEQEDCKEEVEDKQ